MKITTTLNRIENFKPGKSGWKKLLLSLGKTKADDQEIEYLEILKSNGLKDIIHESAIDNQVMPGIMHSLKEYIVPFDKTLKILDKEVEKGKVGYFRKDSQANLVYHIHDKAITLCGEAGGGAAKMGQYLFGCITHDTIEKRQDGQRFSDVEGYIRKLTPVECERLQTVPENYTACVSNSQRYKMLGNGWTVDVIVHILKNVIES